MTHKVYINADLDDTYVHVYPLFGPAHELADTCWCHPEQDIQEPTVLIHNAVLH